MPTFNHSTSTQLAQRLRETYKTLKGWELVKVGRYINSFNLTDNQLKNLFNINDAQLTVLKAKLSDYESKYNEIISQVGD